MKISSPVPLLLTAAATLGGCATQDHIINPLESAPREKPWLDGGTPIKYLASRDAINRDIDEYGMLIDAVGRSHDGTP